MKRPQLSLRDLFWLMLVAAIAVGWRVDHVSAVNELRLLKMHWPFGPPPKRTEPSAESLARGKMMKELYELSDSQLSDRLGEILDRGRHERGPEYEPCLSEMVGRGMRDDLQEHYDQLMSRKEMLLGIPLFPENRELLTALRRTQGKPDPLKSHIELCRQAARGNSTSFSLVQVTMENDDAGKESVFFSHGYDDDSWQIELTNATGQRAPDSNFVPYPFEEGGFRYGSRGPIKFGERERNAHYLDVRRYVKPPRPGKYQLQVFHSGESIARESNFDGLIVLKSEPINVVVEWPDGDDPDVSWVAPIAVLGTVGTVVVWLAVRRVWRTRRGGEKVARTIRWRDWIWLVLVVALAAGWLVDNRYQVREIQRLTPDQEANWTMRLAE